MDGELLAGLERSVTSDAVERSAEISTVSPATLDFLRWISERTATYEEAWELWQTTCPRESTWEDAYIDGYVRSERTTGSAQPIVVLTALGRSILDGAA